MSIESKKSMRWFKHVTDASDDEFIHSLEARFGLEGYARWWKLCEAIGKKLKPTDQAAAVAFPWSVWETILKGKRKQLRSFLEAIADDSRIILTDSGDVLRIELPKLLKFRDEYARKSGHDSGHSPEAPPDKLPAKIQRQIQRTDTEESTPSSDSPSESDVHASDLADLTLLAVGCYNGLAGKWSKPKITPKRAKKLERRIRDCHTAMAALHPDFGFDELLLRVERQSDFFRHKWQAWDLEWFIETTKGEFVHAQRAWALAYAQGDRSPPRSSPVSATNEPSRGKYDDFFRNDDDSGNT